MNPIGDKKVSTYYICSENEGIGRTALIGLVLRIKKSATAKRTQKERAMIKQTEALKYEILYDLPEGEYSNREVGSICTRTITAGDSLEVEAFPVLRLENGAKEEIRRRKTSVMQEKLNLENRRKRVRRLMEANFHAGDWVLHPSYDYGFVDRGFCNLEDVRREWREFGIPEDEEGAKRMMDNLIRRFRRRIRRKGGNAKDFKYIYVIECKRKQFDGDYNALPPRYHYHMVISSLGILTLDDINELWPYGRSDARLLDFRFNGLEALAKYIVKDHLRENSKRYRHSQNLQEPEVKTSYRRISRRRAAQIAEDVRGRGREILESLYPGYVMEDCIVKYSDFVAGAYIYARLRRRPTGKNKQRRQ